MDTVVDHSLVADLAGRISGSILVPDDSGYEAARAVHNGLVDRRPALIVRCRTTDDVVTALALALARRTGLELSDDPDAGGHAATIAALRAAGIPAGRAARIAAQAARATHPASST